MKNLTWLFSLLLSTAFLIGCGGGDDKKSSSDDSNDSDDNVTDDDGSMDDGNMDDGMDDSMADMSTDDMPPGDPGDESGSDLNGSDLDGIDPADALNAGGAGGIPGDLDSSQVIAAVRKLGGKVTQESGQIVGIVLTGPKVNDAAIGFLRNVQSLRTLNLSGSAITSGGISVLQELPELESLDLSRTTIGDDAQDTFFGLLNLKKLNIGGTKMSANTIALIKESLPDAVISTVASSPPQIGTRPPIAKRPSPPIPTKVESTNPTIALFEINNIVLGRIARRLAKEKGITFEFPTTAPAPVAPPARDPSKPRIFDDPPPGGGLDSDKPGRLESDVPGSDDAP